MSPIGTSSASLAQSPGCVGAAPSGGGWPIANGGGHAPEAMQYGGGGPKAGLIARRWRRLPVTGPNLGSASLRISFAEAGAEGGCAATGSVDRCKEKAAAADSSQTARCSEASTGADGLLTSASASRAPVATLEAQ